MKKYLPIIFFVFAVIVFAGIAVVVKGRNNTSQGLEELEEEEVVAELPFDKKPFTSLTPKSDGHWLTLEIKAPTVVDAETLDYELIYKTKQGTTQGVPGTITLDGADIKRDLLLGSESSGKFRYDEGVEEGSLTLRFRNSKGKLVGKLMTDFHLQVNTDTVASLDNAFSFKMDRAAKDYFVTMSTFGLPSSADAPSAGPFGIFSSNTKKLTGTVAGLSGDVMVWDFATNAWTSATAAINNGKLVVGTK